MTVSGTKIAIFCPKIGERSETFIRRHIEELCPGRQVVVTFKALQDENGVWEVSCPMRRALDLSFEQFRFGRHIQRITPPRLVEAYYNRRVFDWLASQDVDVLLGQYLHQSWPFIEPARKAGIRFFAHAHGYDLSKYWRRGLWRHRYEDYRHACGVIVVNRLMRDRMLEAGVPDNRVHIVPYGVQVPDSLPRRIVGGECRFLAIGRMVGKKAPLKLLAAFKAACSKNPELSLDYIGAGPLFSEVNKFVEENGLNDSVRLHGGQPHDFVLNLLSRADVFVQHSVVDPETGDEEGVPVAILEAMAHGLPVISTRHAGIPEAVESGSTGVLVDEGDIEAMAAAMIDLANSSDDRRKMGEAGWRRAKERFTWAVEKRRLLEIMDL